MKTEEQAQATRCCGPEGCGHKQDDGTRFCIANACMGWEWAADYETQRTSNTHVMMRMLLHPPNGGGWERDPRFQSDESSTSWRRVKHERGDCGLKRKQE